MTFKDIENKMAVAFEAIKRLTEELGKVNARLEFWINEEKKLAEGVKDTCESYLFIKSRDVPVLATFRIIKGNKECIINRYENAKFRILATKKAIKDIEQDLEIYKNTYAELENLYQTCNNVLRFVNVKKEENKPN